MESIEEKIETILCDNEMSDGVILTNRVITSITRLFKSQLIEKDKEIELDLALIEILKKEIERLTKDKVFILNSNADVNLENTKLKQENKELRENHMHVPDINKITKNK